MKIDSVGNLIWQRSLGGSYVDYNATSKVDALGNLYVAALAISIDGDVTGSHGGGDAWLVKLDQNGNILWQKCFGGTGGDQFNNLDIKGTKLVMTGWTTSVDGDLTTNYGVHDAWVVLTDTSGNIVFSQNYGGSLIDEMFAVKFTIDNKIIAGGYSYSNDVQVTMNHTPKDCWLICVDSIGNLIWQNSYGGSDGEGIDALLALNNGSIYFAGGSASPNNGDVTGHHAGMVQQSDFWIVKLSTITGGAENIAPANSSYIYPNPAYDFLTICMPDILGDNSLLQIFNNLGQVVFTNSNLTGLTTIEVNISNLNAGIYFYEIRLGENYLYSGKFAIVK